jgi:DNA-binding IclR family transcriptional regulator
LSVHLGLEKLDTKKASAHISRLLRILRAHRIIRKSPGCHRYFLTPKGRVLAAAVLQVQVVTLQQVARAAA